MKLERWEAFMLAMIEAMVAGQLARLVEEMSEIDKCKEKTKDKSNR